MLKTLNNKMTTGKDNKEVKEEETKKVGMSAMGSLWLMNEVADTEEEEKLDNLKLG